MKKQSNILILAVLFLITYTCDDILEEDITNDVVQTTAPSSNSVIEGNTVQFSWLGIDGADNYRIQITKQQSDKNSGLFNSNY